MPRLSLLLALCLLCGACVAPRPSVAITAPTPTAAAATLTALRLPTQTAAPATHTAAPLPTHPHTLTPTHAPSHTPTPPNASSTSGRIEHFQLVGRHDLGRRGWNTGLALAQSCAYIGNRRLP